MKTFLQNYWWRTKAFKLGFGIFIVVAVLVAVLFGDQISQLLDLFGSRAAVGDRTLIVNDQNETTPNDGHGWFGGTGSALQGDAAFIDLNPGVVGDGYITLE